MTLARRAAPAGSPGPPTTGRRSDLRLAKVVRPSSLHAPPGLARTPPRPPSARDSDYLERFDSTTLFYDVFRVGGQVVGIGPPLIDLADGVAGAPTRVDGHPRGRPRTTELDRTQRTMFGRVAGTGPHRLSLEIGGATLTAVIGDDGGDCFRDRRALMTLSLDNDLAWITDWVRWHVSAHGTDAVVFYDNGSTAYGLDHLLAAIASVPGIAVAVVVDWSFPYGPLGVGERHWDSDYAQHGALEHARWRFLTEAAGFLNADVDELVFDRRGRSVYDLARRSATGFVGYGGTWAHPHPGEAAADPPRHRDARWVKPADTPCADKWCAVPRFLPAGAQLKVHHIAGGISTPGNSAGYWHVRSICTNWKVNRTAPEWSAELVLDEPLAAMMDRYLGGGAPAPAGVVSPPVRGRRRGPAVTLGRALEGAAKRSAHRVARRYKRRFGSERPSIFANG